MRPFAERYRHAALVRPGGGARPGVCQGAMPASLGNVPVSRLIDEQSEAMTATIGLHAAYNAEVREDECIYTADLAFDQRRLLTDEDMAHHAPARPPTHIHARAHARAHAHTHRSSVRYIVLGFCYAAPS